MKHKPGTGIPAFAVIIVLIILLGLLPRVVELVSGNYLFSYDQGLFYEKVKRIAVDHKPTLIGEEVGGRGGFFQGPGFYYLLSVPFLLFGGDPYGGIILMAFTGLATLAIAAYASARLLGKRDALCITFLMAVSPAMVSQARFVWNPFFVPLLSTLIVFAFYRVLLQRTYALPAMYFFIGLLFHFEIATGIMVFIQYSIFTLYLWIRKYFRMKDIVAAAAAFSLTQLHFLLFDLRHDFLITKGMFRYVTGDSPHQITPTYVAHMIANHWDVFRNQFSSTFAYGSTLWPYILGLMLVGTIAMLRDKHVEAVKKQFIVFLAASPVISFVLYMKYLWPMWEWWILELGIVYTVLLGSIAAWGWQKGKLAKMLIAAGVAVFLIAHGADTVRFYKTDYSDYGGTHKIRGKLDAIDTIYKDANGVPFNLIIFSPPVYTYPYDYLLWWHGKRAYGYVPGKNMEGLTYLLIEPDPAKPWSHKGWLETVVKGGRTVETISLPSGFVIEKRMY